MDRLTPRIKMEGNTSISPVSASTRFCDIEPANILPQRLRSAVKTKSKKAADYFNADSKSSYIEEDYEISFPALQSAKKSDSVVRSLMHQFEREGVNAVHSANQQHMSDSGRDKLLKKFTPNSTAASKKLSKYTWEPSSNTSSPTKTSPIVHAANSLSDTSLINRCSIDADLDPIVANPIHCSSPKIYMDTALKQSSQSTASPPEVTSAPSDTFMANTEKKVLVPFTDVNQLTDSITSKLVPQDMSFDKVIDILQKLELRVANNVQNLNKIDDISKRVDIHKKKISLMSGKIDDALSDKEKVSIMADIIVRQEDKITQLNDTITALQARSMKQNIIISGITETPGEDCAQISKNFLQNKLEVQDLKIEVAHRIGNGKFRPLVVKFPNQRQKAKIFGNIRKLKGLKNENNRYYRIDDHLPEELQARKNHLLYHMRVAKSVSQG